MIDLTKERQLNLLKEISKCRSIDNNCDYLLEHSDCDDLIDYINELQQENKELKENCEDLFNQKEMMFKNMQLNQLKVCELAKVLNEIRDRATIRLVRLENEPDYCKWFLEGYDNAITVNRVSNSGVAMEWVKNTMITECKDLLQILDKATEEKW